MWDAAARVAASCLLHPRPQRAAPQVPFGVPAAPQASCPRMRWRPRRLPAWLDRESGPKDSSEASFVRQSNFPWILQLAVPPTCCCQSHGAKPEKFVFYTLGQQSPKDVFLPFCDLGQKEMTCKYVPLCYILFLYFHGVLHCVFAK